MKGLEILKLIYIYTSSFEPFFSFWDNRLCGFPFLVYFFTLLLLRAWYWNKYRRNLSFGLHFFSICRLTTMFIFFVVIFDIRDYSFGHRTFLFHIFFTSTFSYFMLVAPKMTLITQTMVDEIVAVHPDLSMAWVYPVALFKLTLGSKGNS